MKMRRAFVRGTPILFLMAMLLLAACGRTDTVITDDVDEAVATVQPNDETSTSLPDQDTPAYFPPNYNEYFDRRTGKWFLHPDGGQIGFGLSSGLSMPGDEVYVSFMAHPVEKVELNRPVRFQLTKRDQNNRVMKVIKEEIVYIDSITTSKKYFKAHLPEEENVYYMLSAEILGDDDHVEDFLITRIYVPIQKMEAELFTDKNQYRSGESMTLLLKNTGPTQLFFGLRYEMVKFNGLDWQRVSPGVAGFNDIGISIAPGQTYEQEIPLNHLDEPGIYRISKEVQAEGTPLQDTLVAQFKMVD
jgi:hypothetical protein